MTFVAHAYGMLPRMDSWSLLFGFLMSPLGLMLLVIAILAAVLFVKLVDSTLR